MASGSLTLLLSDLSQLPGEAGWPSLPALQRLLSRGVRHPAPADHASALFELFSLPVQTEADLPVAALSALGDGLEADSGWWLRADPVHMVADRDQLYLSAADILAVQQAEADLLLGELNTTYAEEGWRFVAATPHRWYLRLPEPLALRTVPTAAAMGSPVGEVLPQGEDAMGWQRVMTEIQMLLHASSVNTARSEKGQLAVNSLWFWGSGELPVANRVCEWHHIITEEPLALGLARLHGVNVEPVGAAAKVSGEVLQLASLKEARRLENELFSPLVTRLRNGELGELRIVVPGCGQWTVDRRALRRWWRRSRSLSSLLQGEG